MKNKRLTKIIKAHGDTLQDVADLLGLKSRITVYRKLHGKVGWKPKQIEILCDRYNETKDKLGF